MNQNLGPELMCNRHDIVNVSLSATRRAIIRCVAQSTGIVNHFILNLSYENNSKHFIQESLPGSFNASLVGGPGPPRPEKYDFVNWDDDIPFIYGKIENGNQTTNQFKCFPKQGYPDGLFHGKIPHPNDGEADAQRVRQDLIIEDLWIFPWVDPLQCSPTKWMVENGKSQSKIGWIWMMDDDGMRVSPILGNLQTGSYSSYFLVR